MSNWSEQRTTPRGYEYIVVGWCTSGLWEARLDQLAHDLFDGDYNAAEEYVDAHSISAARSDDPEYASVECGKCGGRLGPLPEGDSELERVVEEHVESFCILHAYDADGNGRLHGLSRTDDFGDVYFWEGKKAQYYGGPVQIMKVVCAICLRVLENKDGLTPEQIHRYLMHPGTHEGNR